jgi:hypothetical protein
MRDHAPVVVERDEFEAGYAGVQGDRRARQQKTREREASRVRSSGLAHVGPLVRTQACDSRAGVASSAPDATRGAVLVQPDPAVRILLAAILVCLAILIAQGFAGPAARGSDREIGRYSVTGLRAGGPMLVRTDSVTGRVWKLELRGDTSAWVEFREPGAASGPSAPLDEADQERPDPVGGDQSLQ